MPRSSDPDALYLASDASYDRETRLDRDASREPPHLAPAPSYADYLERGALRAPVGLIGRKVTPAEYAAERLARSEWVAAAGVACCSDGGES